MRYTDKKYHFSFDIPEGWKQVRGGWPFRLAQGRVSIVPRNKDANINISCGRIHPPLRRPTPRSTALQEFLSSRGYRVMQLGVGSAELAGETNVVDAVYEVPGAPSGYVAVKISAVHEGTEYVITLGGNYERYRRDLETVTDSFRFYTLSA